MKEIIERVLLKIEQMSDADFAAKLKQYRDDEVAVAIRTIQDAVARETEASWSSFEKMFEIMSMGHTLHVLPEHFEEYAFAWYAANDSRFCLAA